MIIKHIITFKSLQLIKEMTIQLVVFYDYPYFQKHYKMIAIDLSKQQAFHADPKAIQQKNFTGNLDRAEGAIMFSLLNKESEKYNKFMLF